MEIYLVRHGQSEANAGLTTNLDSPLTPLGRAEAEATADYFAANVRVDRAYVSPLVRTLQTAEPICERLHIKATAFPSVCEYFSAHHPDFLTFHGLSSAEIVDRFPFVAVSPEFSCDLPWWPKGFETRRTAYDRAVKVREHLVSRYGETASKILIVTHADPLGHLIEAFTYVDPNPVAPPWSDNCAITHLRVDTPGASATVLTQNDSTHLNFVHGIKVTQ